MVWRLDRLGRSLSHLLSVVEDLDARGIELRSLTESIDTTTAGGRLVFHVFGAVAQFERALALAAERSAAGLAAARAAGRTPGRCRDGRTHDRARPLARRRRARRQARVVLFSPLGTTSSLRL